MELSDPYIAQDRIKYQHFSPLINFIVEWLQLLYNCYKVNIWNILRFSSPMQYGKNIYFQEYF